MNISFVLLFIIIVLHVKPTDGNKNQIKSKTCTPYILLLQTDGIFLFSNKSWEDSDINKNYRELRNQRYHINWQTGKKEEF